MGNLIGSLLSGDAFMRYYRLKGWDALHVSGTDAHGSHVEFEALKRGISPEALYEQVHRQIVEVIDAFGIDMFYTTTESPTHYRFVQDLYRKAEANNFITVRDEELPFCTTDEVFLADRYIQGTCPRCGSPNAYGNQCDDCGALLEPEELIDPHCRICGQQTITFRPTRHWYLDLPQLEAKLTSYIGSRQFGSNVGRFVENLLKEGLKPRAVTRDLKWGIPAPFRGAEEKVLYVWAEAALGYVSATLEHFEKLGEAEGWKDYWLAGENVKHVYTQGKDNIPFHTVFFPAQLLSSGTEFHLPDQISATEYLNWIGGQQFSKTRRTGLYCDDALKLLDSEYWRFYLFLFRPEQRDVSFSWEDLDQAVNGVLVNNIANLIHRVASLTYRGYGGVVPSVEIAPQVARAVEQACGAYQRAIESGTLAPAIRTVSDLAVTGNEYVQRERPWESHKPQAIASAFQLVKALSILLEPFVPSFARRAYHGLSVENPTLDEIAEPATPQEVRLPEPEALVQKIDVDRLRESYEGLVRQETA